MHSLRLLLCKLVHGVVERRNPLALDEKGRPEDLVLDRLLIDPHVQGQPGEAIEKRLLVTQRPSLELAGDSFAQLQPERIRRAVGAVARRLAEPRDPRIGLDDLGEDRLFPEERFHAQLDAAFELTEKLDELVVAGEQEILDERGAVLEDHAEAKRMDGAVLERGAENFGMPEQVTPLRRQLRRLNAARQTCELAIGDGVNRLSMDARARLRARSFRPG